MTVRELPGWPPDWTDTTGGPAPHGVVGVLRSVDWRVDLTGTRDLRLTIEYQGHRWTALYPGRAETRTRFEQLGGDVTLERLYQMLVRFAGETMTRVGDVQLSPPAGLTP